MFRVWIAIVLILFFIPGCGERGKERSYKFSGTLELTEHSVGARAAGRIDALYVDEGDIVKDGQVLGVLDRYKQAKKDYDRLLVLAKQGGVTQQALEHGALAVEDQEIVSPVDGVVLIKGHESGEVVSAGGSVVVVGDRNKLWIRIYVPEGMINQIRMDQSVKVRFDGIKDIFSGHVSYVSPRAEFTPRNIQTSEERITQAFAVKVLLDHPPDYLRPGVAADVSFDIKE